MCITCYWMAHIRILPPCISSLLYSSSRRRYRCRCRRSVFSVFVVFSSIRFLFVSLFGCCFWVCHQHVLRTLLNSGLWVILRSTWPYLRNTNVRCIAHTDALSPECTCSSLTVYLNVSNTTDWLNFVVRVLDTFGAYGGCCYFCFIIVVVIATLFILQNDSIHIYK